MTENSIEILLVEDNPQDVKLTLHAFKKHKLANHIHVARDGAEALHFLFGTGPYAGRRCFAPAQGRAPRFEAAAGRWHRSADPNPRRPRTATLPVVILTSSRGAGRGVVLSARRQQLHCQTGRFRSIHRSEPPAWPLLALAESAASFLRATV